MRLEVEAWIQHGLAQHAVGDELKHDQQAADPPVSVEERVDGLELDVRERRLDE